jgi:hypothetical protein
MDWRDRLVLSQLAAGATMREAAGAASMTRQGVWWRRQQSPEFAHAVASAREAGKAEREYRAWLGHSARGKRPPTGKGHGGKPRFTYGRRG